MTAFWGVKFSHTFTFQFLEIHNLRYFPVWEGRARYLECESSTILIKCNSHSNNCLVSVLRMAGTYNLTYQLRDNSMVDLRSFPNHLISRHPWDIPKEFTTRMTNHVNISSESIVPPLKHVMIKRIRIVYDFVCPRPFDDRWFR